MMGTLLLGWDTDSLMKYNICYFIKLIKLSNFLHVNFINLSYSYLEWNFIEVFKTQSLYLHMILFITSPI